MNILTILTTATPRPDIHQNGMYDVVNKLIESNTQDEIHWFINMDKPAMFDKKAEKESLSLVSDYAKKHSTKTGQLHIYLLAGHKESHFGAAAKRLYTAASRVRDTTAIEAFLWLEDDWKLTKSNIFLKEIKDFFRAKHDILLCTDTKFVSGNPFLFKKDFFNIIVSKYKASETAPDPELLLFECVKERYNTDDKRCQHPSYKQRNVFQDIGREWRARRSIGKLNKYKTEHDTSTWEITAPVVGL